MYRIKKQRHIFFVQMDRGQSVQKHTQTKNNSPHEMNAARLTDAHRENSIHDLGRGLMNSQS